MKLVRREEGGIIIFDLEGDFDSRSAFKAKDEINPAIQEGNHNVIINLEGVKYVDSAGLGTLVSALKTARELGGNVWLAGMTAQVKMVVELTRLHRVFDIFDTVETALTTLLGDVTSEARE